MNLESIIVVSIIGAAIASYFWRFLGVYLSRRMSAEHPIFVWCKYVAYATISAVLVRMMLMPANLLAEIPFWQRATALLLLFVLFFLLRRQVMLSVILCWFSLMALYFLFK